jgi:hypothetical protein
MLPSLDSTTKEHIVVSATTELAVIEVANRKGFQVLPKRKLKN